MCLVCERTVAVGGAHAPLYHLLGLASCSNVCFNTRFVMSAARTTRGCMFRQATIQAKPGFGTFLRKADKENNVELGSVLQVLHFSHSRC